VVYQGTFTAYSVAVTTDEQVLVHHQNATAADVAAIGDRVWLSWTSDHSYLIQEETDEAARSSR
jgi:spermidine/putrescine transport system ATP-binding protein